MAAVVQTMRADMGPAKLGTPAAEGAYVIARRSRAIRLASHIMNCITATSPVGLRRPSADMIGEDARFGKQWH